MFLISDKNDRYCALFIGSNKQPLIYRADSEVLGFNFKEIEDGISDTNSNYHRYELASYLDYYRKALEKYKKLVSLL